MPMMTETKMAPLPVLFGQLTSGQKFVIAPVTDYTPLTPGFIFMKLAAETDSRYTAVNLTTGIQSAMLANTPVVPVGLC